MCKKIGELAIPALEMCLHLKESLPADGCPAKIHSVFNRAVNLLTPLGLVTILPREKPLYPFSIRLDTQEDFPALGIKRDMEAVLSGNELTIAGCGLHILLDGAVNTELSVFCCEELLLPHDIGNRLLTLAQVIGSQHKIEGIAPLVFWMEDSPLSDLRSQFPHNHYTSFLLPRIQRLFDAVKSSVLSECIAAASAVVGCGPGLTPSSDDFLCGFFSAMLAKAQAKGDYLRAMDLTQRMAGAAMPKTNLISGSFLYQSARGLFSADVLETLVQLFSNGSTQALQSAALKVAYFGETSGSDILSGIYFGAKIK